MDNDSMDRYLKEEDEGIAYVEYAWKPPSCKYCGKSNLQWKQNRNTNSSFSFPFIKIKHIKAHIKIS